MSVVGCRVPIVNYMYDDDVYTMDDLCGKKRIYSTKYNNVYYNIGVT